MSIESTRAVARAASTLGDAAADAARLRDLPGTSYTAEDAVRLRELVATGPAEVTAGLPRRLQGHIDLDHHLGNVIDPPASVLAMGTRGAQLERFLAAWRVNVLPPDERATLVTKLQTTPASEFGADHVRQLDALSSESLPAGLPRALPELHAQPIRFEDVVTPLRFNPTRELPKEREQLQRFLDAWHVSSLSDGDAAAEAAALRAKSTSDYSQRDYARLEALNGSAVTASRIDMPGSIDGLSGSFDGLVSIYRKGSRTKPDITMHRYIATWRAVQLSNPELRAATVAMVSRDPLEFDKKDLLALRALMDANTLRGNPLRMPTEPLAKDWYTFDDMMTRQITRGDLRFDPSVLRIHFAQWMQRLDPGWDHRARTAMMDAASGRLATFEPGMPTAIAGMDDGDLWRLEPLEQVRLGVALLSNAEIHATRRVGTPLELLTEGLTRLDDVAPELVQLRDDTAELAERNLELLKGGQTTGLEYQPDFAEVGRVRSSAQLIERSLSTPHVEIPAVIDADAAKVADTISW